MTICHFSYRLVLAELKFGPTTAIVEMAELKFGPTAATVETAELQVRPYDCNRGNGRTAGSAPRLQPWRWPNCRFGPTTPTVETAELKFGPANAIAMAAATMTDRRRAELQFGRRKSTHVVGGGCRLVSRGRVHTARRVLIVDEDLITAARLAAGLTIGAGGVMDGLERTGSRVKCQVGSAKC